MLHMLQEDNQSIKSFLSYLGSVLSLIWGRGMDLELNAKVFGEERHGT